MKITLRKYLKRIGLYSILAAFIVSFAAPTAQVFAISDVRFYATNNILFYDPDSCGLRTKSSGSGSNDTSLVGNDNYEKGLRFFVAKGLTLAQAAGILGNFKEESRMNPAIIQGGEIAKAGYSLKPGVGFGIAQWTSGGRQNNLMLYAKSTNAQITDLGMQLGFVWKEVTESYAKTLTNLKKETTPEKAARVFHDGYEVSADNEAQLKERADSAKSIYNTFKAKIPDGLTEIDGSGKNGNTENCTGPSGSATKFAENFKVYDQNSAPWGDDWYGGPSNPNSPLHGTVGSAGCGPSSMAMTITALTGKDVNPGETAAYGRTHGTVYNENGKAAGSYHNIELIGKNWGLEYKQIDKTVTAINAVLRSDGIVVVSGGGAGATPPFTNGGHFVTIRAISSSGKWLLGDSNGKIGAENSKKEWEPTDIANRIGGYHFAFFAPGKKAL